MAEDNLMPYEDSTTVALHEILFGLDGNEDLFEEADTDLSDLKIPILNEPVIQTGPPPRGDFSGRFDFEISLSGETTNRKKYVYSNGLNRVFLCMNAEMAVQFSWDWDSLKDRKLWVRATPILARSEQQEARVLRCHNHRVASDTSNRDIPSHVIPHVMRSVRQGPDVVYCGSDQDERSWLSVALEVPPRPPRGVPALQHVYLFCCKHSCISGINRRPIEVLFTLEDANGEVLGRRSLGVRVCSCPRRDMEKEEAEQCAQSGGPPPRKRARQHPPASQPWENTSQTNKLSPEYWIQAIYNFNLLAMEKLPPNSPAAPLLFNFTQEMRRFVDEIQKKN